MSIDLNALNQEAKQELHRDRIAQVYLGEVSDSETQRRARSRIDWMVTQCEGPRVYDIGCSEGITSIKLAEHGLSVDAIDIHPDVIKYAEELAAKILPANAARPNFYQCDLFARESIEPEYDTVILGEVLEHVYEPRHMLQRAALALKSGGRLIVTTPWGYFPAPDHHQTFYLSNFLTLVPAELRLEHLDVIDGYIRLVARKDYDPRDEGADIRSSPANMPEPRAVLELSERAALASQQRLRSLFDHQTERLRESWKVSEQWKLRFDAEVQRHRERTDLLEAENKALLQARHHLEGQLSDLRRALENIEEERRLHRGKIDLLKTKNHALSMENQQFIIEQLKAENQALIRSQQMLNDLRLRDREELKRLDTERKALLKAQGILQSELKARASLQQHLLLSLRMFVGAVITNEGFTRKIGEAKLRSVHFVARTSYAVYCVAPVRAVARTLLSKNLRKRSGAWIQKYIRPVADPAARTRETPVRTKPPVAQVRVEASSAGLGGNAVDLSLLRDARDFVVVCNSYPGAHGNYGGEFIRSRAEGYVTQGLKGCIVEFHKRNSTPQVEAVGGIPVLRVSDSQQSHVLSRLRALSNAVLVHSPSPEMQQILPSLIDPKRITYWFHGFEVIDYRKFYFNYTTAELELRRKFYDDINAKRMRSARETFADPRIAKVFVSDYLMRAAARHVGISPQNAHVIHNFIDSDFYNYRERDDKAFSRILLLRPFVKRKYAADIAIGALLRLSRRPEFNGLSITVVGFGGEFRAKTEPLRAFSNVRILERYNTPEQMRELYAEHGVYLCPTRHDTQGVSFCEAMASGMVCVTNRVSAIPEFADDTTAILRPSDNIAAYADGILQAVSNASAARIMGRKAAERMRAQCGIEATLVREMNLIRRS